MSMCRLLDCWIRYPDAPGKHWGGRFVYLKTCISIMSTPSQHNREPINEYYSTKMSSFFLRREQHVKLMTEGYLLADASP